eukprot:9490148-Pyramimonas_sp.AAC.1
MSWRATPSASIGYPGFVAYLRPPSGIVPLGYLACSIRSLGKSRFRTPDLGWKSLTTWFSCGPGRSPTSVARGQSVRSESSKASVEAATGPFWDLASFHERFA